MRVDRNSKTSGNGRHTAEQPPTGETSAPKADENLEHRETTEIAALRLLLDQFRRLGEHFSYYVAAKTDSVKLSLRSTVVGMTLGALGFVSVVGLILMASWFVLNGVAGGLGALFGERPWLGSIIAGLLLLAGLGGGMYYALGRHARTARDRTVQKYEERRTQQPAQFGGSVSDGAEVTSSEK